MVTAQAELTEEQEARRREGLRMLARIIARHYLAQPQSCAAEDLDRGRATESDGGPMSATEEG